MTLGVIQPGKGAARPLVIAFGPMYAGKLPAILGPTACIVLDANGRGTETMAQIVDFAARSAGFSSVTATALVGFSIGCSRVRALRVAGASAGAYLLVDGTHANWPPQAWQIAWLRDLADLARGGKALLVASHTYQTYTEKIPGHPFASSVTVLRLATGFQLAKGGPPTAPILTRDPVAGPPTSGLWVYSYASAEADYEAHKYQGGPALQALAQAHLAPWLASIGASIPANVPATSARTLMIGDSHGNGLAYPLRLRLAGFGVDLAGRAMDGTTLGFWGQQHAMTSTLAEVRPSVTFVSLGTNDFGAGSAEDKRPFVGAIVARIRAAGSAVAWVLPPRMTIADRAGVRAMLAAELARLHVPAFPSEALDLPLQADGVHPTAAGYDLWSMAILAWLGAAATAPGRAPSPAPVPARPAPSTVPQAAPERSGSDLGVLAPLALSALAILRS